MPAADGLVEVRVLGPLEVRRDNQPVVVPGAKPRQILTLLGLHHDAVVSRDGLVELLWADEQPRTVERALRTHVAALRGVLGQDAIVTRGTGWQMTAATTDVAGFEAAAEAGRAAADQNDPAAVAWFDQALELWRGPPELPATPRGRAEVTRWVETREALWEDRIDALLALGQAAELVGVLEEATAALPFRERRWGQLLVALYRAGRQADALAAYQKARTILAHELGVEPGKDLRRLETAILTHDPTLDSTTTSRQGTGQAAEDAQQERPGTVAAVPHFPRPRTSFVGRQDQLRELDQLLRTHQEVTIVGPGGVGKTRLAIAAAEAAGHTLPLEVVLVDLVPVSTAFVLHAVATTLGVVERPQQPLAESVYERLRRGATLLVLDNCEHVADAVAPFVGDLLAACPDVTVLATSRERLGTVGERVVNLPPLELVDEATGSTKGSEAVTLFLDRARSVTPEFDADPDLLGGLCTRLDGMPLAIELAAARCGSLGIDGLKAGLDDRLRLLHGARGATERHRSLRAVLDWSHDLLDDDEQRLFRRLGVFAGGFDLPAAGAVSDNGTRRGTSALLADIVGRLTDKNLLVHRPTAIGSRWRLLESVRIYALERLEESGELANARARHLQWAADLALELEQQIGAGVSWPDVFDAVADDLRAAVDGSPQEPRDGIGHALARALGHLAYARGFVSEAREHYEAAAARASDRIASEDLRTAAGIAYTEMRADLAFRLLLTAAERSAAAADGAGQTIALASAAVLGARAPGEFAEPLRHEQLRELVERARTAAPAGNALVDAYVAAAAAWNETPQPARCEPALAQQALEAARRADDPVLVCAALDGVTTVALAERRFRDAAHLAHERLELLDRLDRHDPRVGSEISDVFHMAVETALAAGDLPGARAAAQAAREDRIGRGVPLLSSSRFVLSAALSGAFDDAMAEATSMRDAWETSGHPAAGWMAPAICAAGLVCGLRGDQASFEQWSRLALQVTRIPTVQGFAAFADVRVALHQGRIEQACIMVDELPAEYLGKFDGYARAVAAEIVVVARRSDATEYLATAATAGEQNDWAAACLARAAGRLHGDRDALRESIAGWERIEARFERACTLLLLKDRADEARQELRALGCPRPAPC